VRAGGRDDDHDFIDHNFKYEFDDYNDRSAV
jgi:hypothetical protein